MALPPHLHQQLVEYGEISLDEFCEYNSKYENNLIFAPEKIAITYYYNYTLKKTYLYYSYNVIDPQEVLEEDEKGKLVYIYSELKWRVFDRVYGSDDNINLIVCKVDGVWVCGYLMVKLNEDGQQEIIFNILKLCPNTQRIVNGEWIDIDDGVWGSRPTHINIEAKKPGYIGSRLRG